jgi:ABC-type xylose transport system substrate-binding protein/tRNA A-37 threonylcarbamoyl transferase component Bud32
MSKYSEDNIILKNYRIERSIGQGAFGEVYLATHLGLNGKRAVKVLLRDEIGIGSTEYDEYRNRFRQESQLMEWFNHTNIIRVYDFQEEDNTLFLIMEYASGGSLKQKLDDIRGNNSRIDINSVINLGIDVAEGLSVMHKRDVIHRDLKPSNILFDSEGHAKVADLGLAQVPGGASMRSQLSVLKAHPGTPMYMSPEQEVSGAYLRPSSDIYSLGLILFECLTGRSHKNIRPGTHIRELVPEVPEWFDAFLLRMLSDSPKERPWDGAETAEELRKGLQAGDAAMREAREKEQQEALERARLAEQQRQEEERLRKIQEERVRQAALEKARLEEEERKKQAARERLQKEAEEQTRLAAEEKARQLAAWKARQEQKEKERLAAEQRKEKIAQEIARKKAEEQAQQLAEWKARQQEKEKARLTEQERIRKAAEEKAQKEADEKARLEEQITLLETQGKEACEAQDWPAARGIVKQLKKLGHDGQAAALRLKAEIKDEPTPVWKKYWWAGAAGAVVVAGLILWQAGLLAPLATGTPKSTSLATSTSGTPATQPVLADSVSVTPTIVDGAAFVNYQPTATVSNPLTATQTQPVFDRDKLLVGIVIPDGPRYEIGNLLKESLSADNIKSDLYYYRENQEAVLIESAIEKKTDILVVLPGNSQSDLLIEALEKAKAQGIKIITTDRLLYEDNFADALVSINPEQFGKAQAEYLIQKAGNRKRIPLYLYAGQKTEDNYFTELFNSAYSLIKPKIDDGTFIIGNQDNADRVHWIDNPLTNLWMKKEIRTTYKDFKAGNLAKANLALSSSVFKGDVFILAPEDLIARQITDAFLNDKSISSFVITGVGAGNAALEVSKNGDRTFSTYANNDLYLDIANTVKSIVNGDKTMQPARTEQQVNGVVPSIMKVTEVGTEDPSGPTGSKYSAKACDRMQLKYSGSVYSHGKVGEKFLKTWLVKNDGSCTWTKEYSLVYKTGDLMGGKTIYNFPRDVSPGQVINIEIELVAPGEKGFYACEWVVKNDKGKTFAERNLGWDNTVSSLSVYFDNERN